MGAPPFTIIFTKGNNFCDFLFAFLPTGANSFLLELTPKKMGGKTENKRVASPENVSIHFKI